MIYYFKGDKINGIDLTSKLEDIAWERFNKRVCKELKSDYYACSLDIKTAMKRKFLPKGSNPNAIEGERENYLYYLTGMTVKRVELNTFKSFLIRLVGKNINK